MKAITLFQVYEKVTERLESAATMRNGAYYGIEFADDYYAVYWRKKTRLAAKLRNRIMSYLGQAERRE
jgi:hypothetical protein